MDSEHKLLLPINPLSSSPSTILTDAPPLQSNDFGAMLQNPLGSIRDPSYGRSSELTEHSPLLLGLKRLPEGISPNFATDLGETSPERKKRKSNGEQEMKRHKYDILKAFFRVFFKVDKDSVVLKDAIYNLYATKISDESRIARNAMYRHMWSYFKDKITAAQSNYREYVKGIKMLTNEVHLTYEGSDKDLEMLRAAGVNEIFDFQEEDFEKNEKLAPSFNLGPVPTTTPLFLEGDTSLIAYIEQLETNAQNLLDGIRDVKSKIKKKD